MGRYQAYPEYRDSGISPIGEIPTKWKLCKLKTIVDENRQITYGIVQAGPNIEDGVPYIRPADMTDENGIRDCNELLRTSFEIAKAYTRSEVFEGDIVCSIGPSFGKLLITPRELHGANLTQGTARVAVNKNNLARFIFWALRAPSSYQQWDASCGGATFRALNLGPLADTFIVCPTFEEQQKIANFLDHETAKIDTLIEKQQQLIQLLKEKRQAVISHAVTKGLNPNAPMKDSGVEWLGEVPEHWDVCRLGDYALKIGSGKTPKGGSEIYLDEGVLFLRSQNIYDDGLRIGQAECVYIDENVDTEMSSTRVFPGDILLNITGGSIGRTCIVPEPFQPANVNQHVCIIRMPKVLRVFISFFMKSTCLKEQIDFLQNGGNREGLNFEQIRKFSIALPPRTELDEICDYINQQLYKFDEMVSQSEQAIQIMQERRTALISAAVTGKIDVRNWQAPQN